MVITIYMYAVFRISNRNFVAWNCALLCGIVRNCAQLFSYCVELLGNYRACNSVQVKSTCVFLFRFSIVFNYDRFVFGKKAIVFKNDPLVLNF